MIAALTLGSGSPHLLRSVFVDHWEVTVFASSLLAVGGGLLVLRFGSEGPFDIHGAGFNPRAMLKTLTERGQRLTLIGLPGAHVGIVRYVGLDWRLSWVCIRPRTL